MRFPDNWFREVSPADIIARVGTVTLANISLLGTEELLRIGWLNNPVIDILYSMTSTGVWVARTDADGYIGITNGYNLPYIYYSNKTLLHPTIGDVSASMTGSTTTTNLMKRIKVKDCTLVNGAVADQELVAAKAGYYGVVRILGIYSSDAVNGDTVTLNFEDEDDTDLYGAPADIAASCTATAFTTDLEGLTMSQATQTDNKALECDLDTGGGAGDNGKIIYIVYEYWYET